MTNGNFGTEVIANRMFKEMFQFANTGRASAIAVVLFVIIIPIMYANIRQKLKGEEAR
jgi:alpha-glucoside transport system permease protein